jgi:hypothetical protein
VSTHLGDAFLDSMLPRQPATLPLYIPSVRINLAKNAIKKCIATAYNEGHARLAQLQFCPLPYAAVFPQHFKTDGA